MKRLHILVGLFNLTAICVFAITGIAETFPSATRSADTRVVPYEAPPGLDDRQVAADFVSAFQIPMFGPVQASAVRRNERNLVTFEFYSVNGPGRVTILEPEREARIEVTRQSLGRFLTDAHGATLYHSAPILTMRLWSLYIDCSIYSLLFMAVTGPWLWLRSRPDRWLARIALAAGAGVFALLWVLTR